MRLRILLGAFIVASALFGCSTDQLTAGGGSETTNANVKVFAGQGMISIKVEATPLCTSNVYITDSTYDPITAKGFVKMVQVIGSETIILDSFDIIKANVMAIDLKNEKGCFIKSIDPNSEKVSVFIDTFRTTRAITGTVSAANTSIDTLKIGLQGTYLYTVVNAANTYSIGGVPLQTYKLCAVAVVNTKGVKDIPYLELQRDVTVDSMGNSTTLDLYFSK
jgi:hypothetical protein